MLPIPSSMGPLDCLSWLLGAQSALSALADGDDYALYELMHHQAALLAPVDACYVCLFRPNDDTLFFSYNFDKEIYDEPLTVPVGDGPTSWVVRHGLPFVLNSDNKETHNANINFGDGERVSQSAVHLPLATCAGSGSKEVLAVFSVQSYCADVYNDAIVLALQLWCDQVARRLHYRRAQLAHTIELQRIQGQLQAAQTHQIRMADHFVELLQPVTRQARELSERLKQEALLERAQLKAHVESLCRSCYRVQTEASQLPLTPHPVSEAEDVPTIANERNPLHDLSASELEVLRLLATGASNPQIAASIGRGVDTVKKHCAAMYRKLDARNRTEAARIYSRYAASTKNIQLGNPNSP